MQVNSKSSRLKNGIKVKNSAAKDKIGGEFSIENIEADSVAIQTLTNQSISKEFNRLTSPESSSYIGRENSSTISLN